MQAKRYYLDEEGHKVSGFVKINDKKYYFNEDGKCLLRIPVQANVVPCTM
ncbi:MAG: hypothetical protein ACLTTO_06165 [Lachnospiraceae bacterium]